MPDNGPSVRTKVTLEGDFFRRDPGKTLYANIGEMLDALAEWMQREIRDDIASHAGSMDEYSGWSWAHTRGRRSWSKHWAVWAAVEADTQGMSAKDAIRTKAAAATIERRWHPYRRVKAGVYRARPLITANLTEGME
jgi:hypothetical protein